MRKARHRFLGGLILGKLKRIHVEPNAISVAGLLAMKAPELQHEEAILFASFVESMLVYPPDERPTAATMLEHDWLKS